MGGYWAFFSCKTTHCLWILNNASFWDFEAPTYWDSNFLRLQFLRFQFLRFQFLRLQFSFFPLISWSQCISSKLEILDDVATDRHVRAGPGRVEPGRGPARVVRSDHRARARLSRALLVLQQLLEDGKDLPRVHLVQVLVWNALVSATWGEKDATFLKVCSIGWLSKVSKARVGALGVT